MPWVESLVGGLIGFSAAVVAEPLRARLFRAKLEFEFGQFLGCALESRKLDPKADPFVSTRADGHDSIHYRMRVINKSRWTAKGVRLFLSQVEVMDPSRAWGRVGYADTLSLPWSCRSEGRLGGIQMPSGIPHFADLISAREIAPKDFQMEADGWSLRYSTLIGYNATYRFTVTAVGDNCPATSKAVVLTWNGDWRCLRQMQPSTD